jgi:hypothetical protein
MFDVVEYILTGIFALEVLIGIFALGFVNGLTSWLQISGMNVLDFVVLLFIIAEYIAKALGYTSITVLPFRLLRTLKILSYFKMFFGIRVIVTTLIVGGAQMLTVLFVLIFFLLVMSTLLLTFLRDSFSRRCVVLDQFNGSPRAGRARRTRRCGAGQRLRAWTRVARHRTAAARA